MNKMIYGILLFTLSSNLFAISDSATLKLKGQVDATTSITFKNGGDDITKNVNILAGETDKILDTAVEESNSHTGYRVSISSANSGLKHQLVDANYGYKLIYDTQTVDVVPGTILNDHELILTGASNKKVMKEREVKINLVGHPDAPSGEYSDTLTLTIATNG